MGYRMKDPRPGPSPRQVAREFFSYEVLEAQLRLMVERTQNIYRLLRRGLGRRRKFAPKEDGNAGGP